MLSWSRGAGIYVLYSDSSLKWHAVCMYGFSRDAQQQATVNTSYWNKPFVLHKMWWKSPVASHGRTLVKCHCQVIKFLLHKYKRISKSKLTASDTLLNSAEYSITRKKYFSFLDQTSCQYTATVTYREALFSAKYQFVCAPAKRVRQWPSLPLSAKESPVHQSARVLLNGVQ
jgi:hypothetical protein